MIQPENGDLSESAIISPEVFNFPLMLHWEGARQTNLGEHSRMKPNGITLFSEITVIIILEPVWFLGDKNKFKVKVSWEDISW